MKKWLIKSTAVLLSVIMLFSGITMAAPLVGMSAAALNGPDPIRSSSITNQDVSVASTNSFGSLLTGAIGDELAEQNGNHDCVITSVEIEDIYAVVEFQALVTATLVVGIYDEEGVQLLASGYQEVSPEDSIASVTLDIAQMPQYFYVKAYMVDTESLRPLCPVYESPMYTQEMQELLAMEVTDFEEERVLNLDEQTDTNFAVYSDDTIVIPQSGNNDVTYVDEETGTYIIENADSHITSLTRGDVFAYEYEDGSVIIVKVDSIQINGTTATITGQDSSLDEVFDYVKIDAEAGLKDAEVDDSNLEEGIIYNGIVENTTTEKRALVDSSDSITESMSYTVEPKTFGNDDSDESGASATISGSIEIETVTTLKVYLTLSSIYVEAKMDTTTEVSFAITGQLQCKFTLVRFYINIVPGCLLVFTPSVDVRASGSISLNGSISSTIGFRLTDDGFVNLSTSPKMTTDVKIEIKEIFIGLSVDPRIHVISPSILDIGFTVELGCEATAELAILSHDTDIDNGKDYDHPTERHACSRCMDGDINAKFSVTFHAKLFEKVSFEHEIKFTRKISDFYWSFDYGEFAFTECPHLEYLINLFVQYAYGNPVEGATVQIKDVSCTTDSDGKVLLYMQNGEYSAKVTTADGATESKSFSVDNSSKKIVIRMKRAAAPAPTGDPTYVVYYDEGDLIRYDLKTEESAVISHQDIVHGSYWEDDTSYPCTWNEICGFDFDGDKILMAIIFIIIP